MAWLAKAAAGGAELMKAHAIEKAKLREAEAYVDAKNRTMAATTHDIAELQREKEFMHSRALALAAFSGGGVDDPGVVKILGDLNAEGEYRIMATLWAGQNEAEGLLFRAKEAKREASSARQAGIFNALTAGMSAHAASGGFGAGSTALPSSGIAPGAAPAAVSSGVPA